MVSLSDPKCQNTQLKAMAIAPKCSGIISLISSTFIIQHVLRDRKRRNLTYHRLLLGMSISDFVGSLMCFLSTWPIPRGEACLAAGTTATCCEYFLLWKCKKILIVESKTSYCWTGTLMQQLSGKTKIRCFGIHVLFTNVFLHLLLTIFHRQRRRVSSTRRLHCVPRRTMFRW